MSSAEQNNPPKQMLGKYEMREEIGRGSMGVVYLGYDPFADEEVAIKVANLNAMKDGPEHARSRKLFFNEAKVAGMLKHQNIVQVRDAGVDDDNWYIVMEYIAGDRTLRDHSKPENLMPIEDVVRTIFKCAKALDHAHRNGVVHRDVKPRNILLTPDGDVKVGDFGIALITRLDSTETQVDGYMGSPLYMAPEQIRMETVTNQADIWSLGVVMYELLTGKHPFAATSLPSIIHQITTQPYPPVSEMRATVPKILGHVVDRMLTKDPAHRYKTCLDVAGDISLVFDHLNLTEEELSGREKFNRIKGLAFFRDFSVSEIWEVINANIWLDFHLGEAIIAEGEMDNSFYVIVSGAVDVQRGGKAIDMLKPGDCFGEMGFISSQKRTATIVARGDVSVMKVRASLIERTSLSCQLHFHKVFLNTLVERLSAANQRFTKGEEEPVGSDTVVDKLSQ